MSRGTPRSQHKQRLWEELKREKERIAKIKAELEKMEDIKLDDKSTSQQSKVSSLLNLPNISLIHLFN